MQVFKTAVRIIAKHPTYLLIYVFFLSFMGIFIASSLNGEGEAGDFAASEIPIAVIDRDQSELSQGLTDFLGTVSNLVPVEDDSFALQDAVATGYAGYVVVIPEDYENTFFAAAHDNDDMPVMETTFSYTSVAGSLVDEQVNQYLGLVRAAAILEPQSSTAEILARANTSMEKSVTVETVSSPNAANPVDRFAFYLQWGTYTMTAAIVVCVGVLMGAFNRTDVRRRNTTSPKSSLSLGLQKAAACLLLTIFVWAVSCGMGLIAFGSSLQSASTDTILLLLGAAFIYSLVPLSLGFLLGQLEANETTANAVGNITGMVMSFLGGAWMSLDLLAPEIQTLAHFVPTFWYTQAINRVKGLAEFTPDSLGPILGDLGIVFLFAASLFAIALAAGRLRMKSAEAGGNAAASTTAS